MSWQSYVDDHLVNTGKISRAAILGLAGGVWATSKEYNITPEEQKKVVNGFKDPGAIMAGGIRLAEQKFFAIQADGKTMQGKQKGDGCVLVKTKQAVLVAEYKAPIQQQEAALIVEKLADYLVSQGY